MHLTWSCAFLLLVATSLALPNNVDTKHHANKERSAPYTLKMPPLDTPWTSQVGVTPWPEHPRPLLRRSNWLNLNGIWKYQSATGLDALRNPPFGQDLAQEVLIPSCLESALSGIQTNAALYSWFSTSFEIPSSWGDGEVLLNFGAIDYEATVFVNGQNSGFHRGGYFRFTLSVTKYLRQGQHNELLVFVHDPTDGGDYNIPLGKQSLRPSQIFYTPCSGIWQTVWLDAAPSNHISQLDLDGNMNGQVNITVYSSVPDISTLAEVTVHRNGEPDITQYGFAGEPFQFTVPSPKLWSPDSPTLYNVTVKLDQDQVESYTGFRTISKGLVNGIARPLLNGKFIFMFGVLDQGYWPDGIYTPPSREAVLYDLQTMKNVGFNMIRKHVKVETDLFYQACDEIGLLVVQDMPALRLFQNYTTADHKPIPILPNADQRAEFARQLDLHINQLKNFPSVAAWIIFNEGWGQITEPYHPEFELVDRVKQLDPTRIVDAASGWVDNGAGDFQDIHSYNYPECGTHSPTTSFGVNRIGFQGEFGGLGTKPSREHLWNPNLDEGAYTDHPYTTLEQWNQKTHSVLQTLEGQIRDFPCSGAVWTGSTDIENEVDGLLTYDRRIARFDLKQWQQDIQALYDAAAKRS